MKKCLIKKLIPIEAAPHDVMQALDHYHKAKKLKFK